MSYVAILLIVFSAFIHAGWNLVSKKENPTTSFILLANLTGTILLLPIFILYYPVLFLFPTQVWGLLFFAGFFMAGYHAFLVGAYRRGDMSVAYPLARSSPIIVVAVVTFILGEGKYVSFLCVLGIILIVFGCFILPLKSRNDFSVKNYLNMTCVLALLAAFGTAGYSIIDDNALGILRSSINGRNIVIVTLLYAFMENLFVFIWLLFFIVGSREEQKRFVYNVKNSKKNAAITGIGIMLGYSLVLIAMSFAENISYIVAFRQLSIPIGVILGAVILKERMYLPRVVGTVILFVGLVLVAIG